MYPDSASTAAGTAMYPDSNTAGTAGTAMYPDSAGTAAVRTGNPYEKPQNDEGAHGTKISGTAGPTGTADTALYPDPDIFGIHRCTAGEVGTGTDLYEKSLDIQVHLGHDMDPCEHSNTSSALPRRDQGMLNLHRPGTKSTDDARFKFCPAGVT